MSVYRLMPMNFVRLMIMVADEMKMERGKYETGDEQMGDNDQSKKCSQREHGTQVVIAHLTTIVHHVQEVALPGRLGIQVTSQCRRLYPSRRRIDDVRHCGFRIRRNTAHVDFAKQICV